MAHRRYATITDLFAMVRYPDATQEPMKLL